MTQSYVLPALLFFLQFVDDRPNKVSATQKSACYVERPYWFELRRGGTGSKLEIGKGDVYCFEERRYHDVMHMHMDYVGLARSIQDPYRQIRHSGSY